MRRWILPVLFGFFTLPIVGQDLPETVVLIKQSVDTSGYPWEEMIQLTGEQATDFQLEAHLNTYQKIILYYYENLGAEAAARKGLSGYTGENYLLSQVTQVKVMGTDGEEWQYKFYPWEGMSVEEEVLNRNFFLLGDKSSKLLPSLYVGSQKNAEAESFQLIWVDSGECPDEQLEEQLEIEKLTLQFLNEAGKALMIRTISTDQNQQDETSSARVVRIKTETHKL